MINNILETILKDTSTLTQLKHKFNILKIYLAQNLFGTQEPQEWEQKDLAWLKSLSPTFIKNFNKDNLYDIFDNLQKEISNLKILTIYLAFDPDDTSLTQIGAAARKMFGNLLLDIKYDARLIAGAAVVWKGIYKDYSLRSKIEERKAQIMEGFKKYLR